MRTTANRLRAAVLAAVVGLLATTGVAVTAAPLGGSPPAEPPQGHHVVRAGWTNPEGRADPFVYTSYFPTDLQVHRGDVVEWKFGEGYGSWHSVTFAHEEQRPALFRLDELPGTIGFRDDWLLGHEHGDETKQCGRSSWLSVPDRQPTCVLTADQFDQPGEQFSSSLFDRFLSTPDAGSFTTEVQLAPGTYTYFCKLHPAMEGTLTVVEQGAELKNPTEAELEAQRDADHANAVARRAALSRSAWDPVTQEWTVRIGAETADQRVGIYDYLPSKLTVRRGDRVNYVAGTQEPNTVTFTSLPRGGFNYPGTCDTSSCSDDGRGLPFGLTGLAFPWACDPDDTTTGAPGAPLAWVPSGVAYDALDGAVPHGCIEPEGGPMTPEMLVGPTLGHEQRAPLDLVVDGDTFHNSGILLDAGLPLGYRAKPQPVDAPSTLPSTFPSTFEARFPAAGAFSYVCIAHEFMRGQIDVI